MGKKKSTIIMIASAMVLIIGILGVWKKKETDTLAWNKETVTTEEAKKMYETLTNECEGALIWDLKVGDKIEIKNLEKMKTCQKENHYSKMIAYSYSKIGVTIYVNVLKKENDKLYRLDGVLVDKYNESTLNDALDKGTTYIYTYQKEGNNYKLIQVELMEKITPDKKGE